MTEKEFEKKRKIMNRERKLEKACIEVHEIAKMMSSRPGPKRYDQWTG
jgi:hypothetical protein